MIFLEYITCKAAGNLAVRSRRHSRLQSHSGIRRSSLSVGIGAALMLLANLAFAAAPVAVNDSRNIQVNTSITLNLIANDYDPDGDPIAVVSVDSSNNASITLNSDGSVFYSPNDDFEGTDSFTYTLQENTQEALTAFGTVTINVVKNTMIAGSEGENNQSLAVAMDVTCSSLRNSSDSELGAGRRDLLERCNALDAMAESDLDALNNAFNQIAPEETIALMRVSAESSRGQTSAVSQRIGQLQAGNNAFTFNGMAMNSGQYAGGAAGDPGSDWSAIGFFASAQYEAAERDASDLESGYDSDGSTFTLGVDYRLSTDLIMGLALGITENDLDYSFQNGSLESELTTFILFGSYTMESFSVETQLGYASTSFKSVRNVHYDEDGTLMSDTLYGSTEGSQLLLNAQLQWEWNKNALSVYPFLRFDFMINDVDGYGEAGEGGLPMIIDSQSTEQITLGAGVQTTYVVNQSWGVLIPMAEFTLLSEVNSGFDPVMARFAYDPDPDNSFALQNDGEDKAFAQLALGSSAIFKGGVSAFFQYQQLVGYNNLSAYKVQAGVRYEF